MSIAGRGSINVMRIERKMLVHKGAENIYLDFALFENKDGPDKYGNDGFITQSVPKAMRDENPDLRGPILGNWKYAERPKAAELPASEPRDHAPADEPPPESDNLLPF